MLRTQIVKLARANPVRATRQFSIVAARAAEGDLGGTRSGGSASSDAFSKREAASENKFIREKEMEALKKLKEKLSSQKKHLGELEKHIKDLESQNSGS